jgi:diguanylate cyclase (GGDEF)-like protein
MMNVAKKKKIGFFHKQLITVVGINTLSLLMMSVLLYSNFITDYKTNMIKVMGSKITLLVASSSSALLFDDKQAAIDILSTLEQTNDIRYAQIYDTDKQLFAGYKRPGQVIDMALEDFQNIALFKNKNLYMSRQITMNGEFLGDIVISADTNALNIQRQRYIVIASIVLIISLILAYLLNWRLQKRLTAPIRELINMVRFVAEHKRYHKRLDSGQDDEIGDLILGVNTMLNTIETHEKQLYRRANYDKLTKLPNRHLLMERLSHSINNATRYQTEIAVLFLDLDRFKVINDSLGHTIGDELLVQVTAKLVKMMRNTDTICRWGGDEFVILLENIDQAEDIQFVIDKIIDGLIMPTLVAGHQLHVSTSIGIARFPQDGEDSLSLLKHADLSMYHAKADGIGQFRYFNSSMLERSTKRLNLEMQVHKAFEESDFFLMYQPKLAVDSEYIVGFEALIRWKLDGNFVSPDEFLPIIEDVGLMYEISLWVLEQSCRQNVAWQKAGFKPVSIAVNLPASFIMHPQCLEKIQSILTTTGLAPEYLEIELTENTFIGSQLNAVPKLKALVDLGINIALDDFGTGYSCMSYLQYLPIGTLKIDGSFIKELELNQANEGIVQSIIMLGKSLNMMIVAECVETEQQLSILRSMDCDIIQGYLFSKPLTVDEATTFISKHSLMKEHILAK